MRAGPQALPVFSFLSGSVLHHKGSHRYVHGHSRPTSSWPLLAPRGAHSSSAVCPREDRRRKGVTQALWADSSPSGQGILGSGNSECGPEGGIVPSPGRPLTHWGARAFKIWPGLRVILHKQVALRLESWIKQSWQFNFPHGHSQICPWLWHSQCTFKLPSGSITNWTCRAFGLGLWSCPNLQTQRWGKLYKVNFEKENNLKHGCLAAPRFSQS